MTVSYGRTDQAHRIVPTNSRFHTDQPIVLGRLTSRFLSYRPTDRFVPTDRPFRTDRPNFSCCNRPQYFLQLVPTVYRFTDGSTFRSNQYSATEHLKHVHSGKHDRIPAICARLGPNTIVIVVIYYSSPTNSPFRDPSKHFPRFFSWRWE